MEQWNLEVIILHIKYMNTKVNQLKIGVVLSYLSTGLNMVIQLVYTPVMIRLLGQSEYGLYTLVGSVVSYLSLFNLGFTGSYLRFYSRAASKDNKDDVASLNGMFLTVFAFMSAAALICGFVLSMYPRQLFGKNLTSEELAKAQILLRILVVNVALTFPNSIFSSMTSAYEQFVFQRFLQLAGVLFNPLLCLPLLLTGHGSVAVVLVTTTITIIKLIVNILFCFIKLRVPVQFEGMNFAVIKEIAAFSFFLFLNMIIDQINWSVDKFILGRVRGTSAVAIYGVGAHINSLYTMFSTSISSVFAPRVNRIAAQNKGNTKQEFTELMIKVGRLQYLLLSLIATGIVFFGKYFITDIYATKEYAEAYPVALLLVLPVTIPLIQNLGLEIQRALNKHQFRSIIYFAMAIINIFVSIPLAKRYGPVGAAMGTTISLLLANGLVINIFYAKVIGIDILRFWSEIISCTKGLIIPVVYGIFIMNRIQFKGMVSFLLWGISYCVVYIGSMWLVGMNNYEKQLFAGPCRSVVGRIFKKNDKQK